LQQHTPRQSKTSTGYSQSNSAGHDSNALQNQMSPDMARPFSAADIMRLQHTIGNQATINRLAARIQREDVPTAPVGDLRSWPQWMPKSGRRQASDEKKSGVPAENRQSIGKVKDELELNIPDIPGAALTPEQSEVIKQILDNRANLGPALEKVKVEPTIGKNKKVIDKKGGFMYPGGGSARLKAAEGEITPRRKEINAAIDIEMSREGKWSAVNTYDDAVVTLGKGFTRGMLAKVMQEFFKNDPEARNTFLDLGITWMNDTAMVVSPKGVEVGDNALRLIELEPAILSVFVNMAESDEHGPKLVEAQQKWTLGYNLPPSVEESWTDLMAIRLVAHLIQWRSGRLWKDYANCGGSVHKIIRVALPVISELDPKMGNAHVMTPQQTSILFSFAEGKAKEALDSPDPVALPNAIAPDSMKGVTLLEAGNGKYYRMSPPGMAAATPMSVPNADPEFVGPPNPDWDFVGPRQ
jgi:hypothetical protein